MNAEQLKFKILKSEDQKQESAGAIPDWGIEDGELFIRTMNGEELAEFTDSMQSARRAAAGTKASDPDAEDEAFDSNIRARLLVRVLVDKEGERVFTNEDLAQLNKKSGRILVHLFHKAQELNGLGKMNQDTMVKPSGETQNSASGSDSPEGLEDPQ